MKNSSDKQGGGIYGEDNITLSNLTGKTLFQENTAKEEGGGLFIKGTDKALTMTGLDSFCLINNTSEKHGGGAFVTKEISQTYTSDVETIPGITPVHGETVITGNKSTGGNGGGVCTKRLALSNLQSISISGNSAAENGGGAHTCPDSFPTADTAEQPAAASAATSTPKSAPVSTALSTPSSSTVSSLTLLAASSQASPATSNKETQDPNADTDLLIDYVVDTTISKNTAKKGGGIYAKKPRCPA